MKVSVVLAVYNGEKFLREQIESLLQQTHAIDEFVIIDDHSNDNSIKVIESYNFPARQLIKHKVNVGPIKTFEEGIKKTTGDIIFLCDQDDIWEAKKVETFLSTFKSSKALLCFSDAYLLTSERDFNNLSFIEKLDEDIIKKLSQSDLSFPELLIKQNIIAGAHMAFRKEVKTMDLFPIPTSQKHLLHDRFIALLVASKGNGSIKFISEQLSKYRIHNEQYLGFNEQNTVVSTRAEYFNAERELHTIITERISHKDYKDCHSFWSIRAELINNSFIVKVKHILNLYLGGNYHRYCDRPLLEALADLKL